MKKLFKKPLKPFRKTRKRTPRVRYVRDGIVRYANIDKLTVRTLVARVKFLEGEMNLMESYYKKGDSWDDYQVATGHYLFPKEKNPPKRVEFLSKVGGQWLDVDVNGNLILPMQNTSQGPQN